MFFPIALCLIGLKILRKVFEMKSFLQGSLILLGLCCLSAMGCRSGGQAQSPGVGAGSQTREFQPFQQQAGSDTRSAPVSSGSSSR